MKKWMAALLGFILASGLALAAVTVTVKVGDSLGSIAAQHGTTVAELQRLNGISGVNIRVGQVLKLPSSSVVTVRSGDSLETLAARYGVSVQALRSANNLTGDKIRVGQELRLPKTASVSSVPTASRSSSGSVTVVSGDSLEKIAKRHGVSIQALRTANKLSNDSIRIGQVLLLPSQTSTQKPSQPAATAKTVVVQNGDTLGEIAQRNDTTIEALQAANNLSGNSIRVGQVLVLRPATKPKVSSQTKPQVSSQTKPPISSISVVIQSGDNLEKIAKRNNISVAALKATNNLTSDAIRVGDTLRLPQKPVVASVKPTATKPRVSSSKPVVAKPSTTKPKVSSAKPATAKPSTTKPKVSSAKPATAKPKVSSAKPTATKPTASKPSSSVKPTVSNKPVVSNKPKPSSPAVVSTAKPNTRIISPPPNLPTATGRVVTVTAPTAVVASPPKPVVAAPKPVVTAPKPVVAAPKPVVTAPKPSVVASKPVVVAVVKPQPAPTVLVPKPQPASTVLAPKPQPAPITAKPSTMPSTLGFSEPLELPVTEDSPMIDPALESPFFDATAPEGKPTAPSDLAPEDIEIEIPASQSAASIKPPAPNAPSYSRTEKVLWPLSGTMTSRFGWRSLRGNRYHTGIDLAAPRGTRVYAALSGKVEFAGWNSQGYGYLVIIRGWDNRRYYYGHNSRLDVKRGQWVRQGQVISRVGSTGFSTGPHLHFEIRVGNSARNPLAYLPRSRLALASSSR